MTHKLWASSFPLLMCLVLNEERGWLYKAPSSHLVISWVFLLCQYTLACVFSVSYTLCLYLSLSHTYIHTRTFISSLPLQRIYTRFFTCTTITLGQNYVLHQKQYLLHILAKDRWRATNTQLQFHNLTSNEHAFNMQLLCHNIVHIGKHSSLCNLGTCICWPEKGPEDNWRKGRVKNEYY